MGNPGVTTALPDPTRQQHQRSTFKVTGTLKLLNNSGNSGNTPKADTLLTLFHFIYSFPDVVKCLKLHLETAGRKKNDFFQI